MSLKVLRSLSFLIAITGLAAGCAEANNPGGTSEGGAGAGGAGGDSTASSGGGGAGTSGSGGTPAGIEAVVINEIGAAGSDFVELVNIGTSVVQLAGYGVTDSTDGGDPKLDEVMRFPKGTQIAAGERILIVAEQDPADGVGPHGDCLPDGPETCYWASWGVSASNGEEIFFLSPDDEKIHDKKYPSDAAKDGNSWGRLPDGTGDFQETLATPGKTNVAP